MKIQGLPVRTWLSVVWHTRPNHSFGVVRTPRGVYCGGCGAELSKRLTR